MARLILLAICGTFLLAAKAQFALDPPSSYLDTLHAERSIMEFLGSKTPFSSHSDMFSLAEIPEQCRLVHMSHVIRHGSRHAKSVDSLARLQSSLVAARSTLSGAGKKLNAAVKSMQEDTHIASGSLASHAKSEALKTIAPLWNVFMSDLGQLLSHKRKIVVEASASQRCTDYAALMTDAVAVVAPVENGSFTMLPSANENLLIQIRTDSLLTSAPAGSRSAKLRPYKTCTAAQKARSDAKEAAGLARSSSQSTQAQDWFEKEVRPYERLTPLTALEKRKLEKLWSVPASSSAPARQASVGALGGTDHEQIEGSESAELPSTREEALLYDVFSHEFVHDSLLGVLPAAKCTKFTWGSHKECAIATLAWDLFQVCRVDAGGFALSNGACNVWRQHLPLMEKFDYMMDMVTLHTKGYYSPEVTGATCPLLEDIFDAADAAMHASKRKTTHTPSWRTPNDNYWLPTSTWAPQSVQTASANGSTQPQPHPWSSSNGRGPAWSMRVTHAGTLVPLFSLLGLQEHPFLPTLRERFHVYSREPIPEGASPVNFTRTMQMHRYNRLVALAYGFEDPPESITSSALVPKLVPGQIPPPPPPMPQAPQDQHTGMGHGNDPFDLASFAPGSSRGNDMRATPEELHELNLQNKRLGIEPEVHIPPPVGSQPGKERSGPGLLDDADLQKEVLDEASARATLRRRLRAEEDATWGITQLGEMHGMEHLEHVPQDYVKIMSMYMKGVEGVGPSAFKHPLTASRLVPMGGNVGLALFECGGDPDSRHPRVQKLPVKYRASIMVHGRQVPFPACPKSLYCDWEDVKAYYREQVYSRLPVGQCSPSDVETMCANPAMG